MVSLMANMISNHLSEPQKEKLKAFLRHVGIEHEDWVRIVEYRECFAFIRGLHPERLDALEISGGGRWRQLGFRSFVTAEYPAYDVCEAVLDRHFQLMRLAFCRERVQGHASIGAQCQHAVGDAGIDVARPVDDGAVLHGGHTIQYSGGRCQRRVRRERSKTNRIDLGETMEIAGGQGRGRLT